MRTQVALLTLGLLQPWVAAAFQDSPEELVALQKPAKRKPANKKGSKQPHRKPARSFVSAQEHEVYEGTTESAYENVLAKAGTSRAVEHCTLPSPLKTKFKASQKLGFATKGMTSLLEMMDKETRKPFAYIRYGEAEWECALNAEAEKVEAGDKQAELHQAICDKMVEDLQDFGSQPSAHNRNAWNLFIGVGTGFVCKEENPALHQTISSFFEEGDVQKKFKGWLDSFYFPLVPSKETAGEFVDRALPLLDGRTVVTVGPAHLGNLKGLTHSKDHIDVPTKFGKALSVKRFWEAQTEIYNKMLDASRRYGRDNVVFLVAGGLPMKLLTYRAYRTLGHKDTIIDVGGSLDIFADEGSHIWNQDAGKICRDYPQYTAEGACIKAVSRKLTSHRSKDPEAHQAAVRHNTREA